MSDNVELFEEIKDKIVREAAAKLGSPNVEIRDERYREFLIDLSQGRCPNCKVPLQVVYAEESSDRFRYKYSCGHGWAGLSFKDSFTVRESLKLRKSKEGIGGFILESIQGWFPSNRKDLSPKGVRKVRVIDRENNYYKEEVIDEVTGRVIRFIEEKLSDHRK